ncbi:magnesium transporter MgtE N-terminal domain-containing protein [Streptomyces sp. NPDC056149]|uniref:magnesium transporter MgtE N-terminal domain-containing protein n=1 Tax=Streptomyces sp. NPDC056149 TaxID=3345728 RepID=UPI0035E2A038
MAVSPLSSGPPAEQRPAPLRLSALVRRPVADRRGRTLGRLADVIVRLRGTDYPEVTGLVVRVGRRELFVPVEQLTSFDGDGQVRLESAKLDLRPFRRREGEVLLRADVLGHRLIDVAKARLVRASDVELARRNGRWLLSGLDTRRPRGPLRRLAGHRRENRCRDWKGFEPLIGHRGSVLARRPTTRMRGLRPAEIADLLEDASKDEEREILGRVHQDPELEADVFEELEEERATRLLGTRSDQEIAAVLGRMRADDAADALEDLPQPRRRRVLDLLPPAQRSKVKTLLGFNPDTAGGLMAMDFLALPAGTRIAAAVTALHHSRHLQPEALTSAYATDDEGRLVAAVRLVELLQADPQATLGEVSEPDPVRVRPDTDLVDVALLMADYNLTTLPVVDESEVLLGLITVDDVLEAMLPEDWRRREPAPAPAVHRTAIAPQQRERP